MRWRASVPTGRWLNRACEAPSPPHGGPVDRTPQLRGRKVPDRGTAGRVLGVGCERGATWGARTAARNEVARYPAVLGLSATCRQRQETECGRICCAFEAG